MRYRGYIGRESDSTFPGIYKDAVLDLDYVTEHFPIPLDPHAEKYAVLYNGGIKPEKAHFRYWNDIIYMHFILQMNGYSEDNIYVVYKDGVGEDTYTPVEYPATYDSLDTVFSLLSNEMGVRDTLFFYTTNHGGGGGISVWVQWIQVGHSLTHRSQTGSIPLHVTI